MAGETILNNRYRLIAQQGSGGMAVIYKATDQSLGRTVAVKILRPSLTSDPAFLTRFRNEARSVANLTHPNIVTVHDVGNDGPTHYIVMEYVEGQDLKKIIRTDGALSTERALDLGIQLCSGIGFAHRAGLVHADVKPQNILVTKDDTVKVTDFGIAQALSDTQPGEKQSVVWGSPHYFAPEQAKGEKPSPASDVYSIGVVIFEMLTGRLPYTGANQQELALAHIRDRVPLVSEFNPNIPENLARIIYKIMSKEPSARYRMADQLAHILSSYRDRGREHTTPNVPSFKPGQAQSAPPTQPQQKTVPPSSAPSGTKTTPSNLPTGVEGLPTHRYDIAPHAPEPPQYGRSGTATPGAAQPGLQPQPMPSQPRESSGYYQSQPTYDEEESTSTLDIVTIVLAILAFFAVACLIPLYIAVFQARLGG